MNDYKFRRLEDSEIPESLMIAVGLDNETEGVVLVDLVIPDAHSAYRFSARQFDMFTHAVVRAAKLSATLHAILECMEFAWQGEDEAAVSRVMDRMSEYIKGYAEQSTDPMRSTESDSEASDSSEEEFNLLDDSDVDSDDDLDTLKELGL